jgi:hypothetical protein
MKTKTLLIEAVILSVAILFVIPVVLIFITAFKPDAEIIRFQGILPQDWTWINFSAILGSPEEIPIFRWLWNSLFISTMVTVLVVTVSSMAAYALARLNLPGGRALFFLIIATLMIPGQILLVPVYLILNALGWLDSPLALIVPAGAGAFGVFPPASIFQGYSQGPGGGSGPRRMLKIWHLLACRPASLQTGSRHSRHFHLHWIVERFHGTADFPGLSRKIHPTGRYRPLPNVLLR